MFGIRYHVRSTPYGRSVLHLQDIVSSRSLHTCKGSYRTERRTARLRIEVQLMVVCTDILQLIFLFFNFQSCLEWLGPRKVKDLLFFPFNVNWFVAFKETRENHIGTGTWCTVDQRSHFLIVRSGSLEPWSPSYPTRDRAKGPI